MKYFLIPLLALIGLLAPARFALSLNADDKAASPKDIPAKVLKVLKYVDEKDEPMPKYVGGRTFGNFEKVLPMNDDKGRKIKYREWDVNPHKQGVNRGPERLVTGSDGSAWYSDDHYKTFRNIRKTVEKEAKK